jgi:plasmid maintenance system killer protein
MIFIKNLIAVNARLTPVRETLRLILINAALGDRKDQFAVKIKDNWRLIFESDPSPPPQLPGGTGIDLSAVKAIKFIEIVDYHGK